jgi:hypothetical protein
VLRPIYWIETQAKTQKLLIFSTGIDGDYAVPVALAKTGGKYALLEHQ